MKAYKTVIFFTVVLVMLGIIAYWDEWQTKKDEEKEKTKNLVFSFKQDEITQIEYYNNSSFYSEYDNQKNKNEVIDLSLQKHDDGVWYLTRPIDVKADKDVVDSILESLSMLKYENIVADTKDEWKKFGVDNPQRIITLKSKNNLVVSYYFGSKAPVGYSVYLRVSQSDKVYITNQIILTETNKALKDFRDKSIINVEEAKISKIILNHKNEKIQIAKEQNKYKFLDTLSLYELDQKTIVDYISDLNMARAQDFKDNPSSKDIKEFLDNKRIDLIIEYDNEQKYLLMFSVIKDELYASYDYNKLIFKLGSDLKSKLLKTAWDFRNKHIFKFEKNLLTSIKVNDVLYVKEKGDWFLKDDLEKQQSDKNFKPQSQQKINNLITKLEDTQAVSALNLKDVKIYLSIPPQHILELIFNNGFNIKINFWINKNDKDLFIVQLSNIKDEFYTVSKDILSDINN